MYSLTNISSASSDPITAGLVNAMLNGDQKEVNNFSSMIYARSDIRQNPQLTSAIADIASGINFNGVSSVREL